MGAELLDLSGVIITVRLTGTLTLPELTAVQKQAAEVIRTKGKVRFLVICENFLGWERGGDWGDISFQMENDEYIEKIAIVGEQKWEELALVFAGKGLRPVAIEYFRLGEHAKARAWIEA